MTASKPARSFFEFLDAPLRGRTRILLAALAMLGGVAATAQAQSTWEAIQSSGNFCR